MSNGKEQQLDNELTRVRLLLETSEGERERLSRALDEYRLSGEIILSVGGYVVNGQVTLDGGDGNLRAPMQGHEGERVVIVVRKMVE